MEIFSAEIKGSGWLASKKRRVKINVRNEPTLCLMSRILNGCRSKGLGLCLIIVWHRKYTSICQPHRLGRDPSSDIRLTHRSLASKVCESKFGEGSTEIIIITSTLSPTANSVMRGCTEPPLLHASTSLIVSRPVWSSRIK